jgi:hypothetical protein
MRLKTIVPVVLGAALSLVVAAPAVAATSSATVTAVVSGEAKLVLDSHDSDDGRYAGPVTSPVLQAGKLYVAEVNGTISYYSRSTWLGPTAPWDDICGNPDDRPQIGSPGLRNGPVGMDAEVVFARPCFGPDGAKTPKPGRWDNFEFKTNNFFYHSPAVGGPFTSASWSHAYDYVLRGFDKPAQFRLRDIPGTADNYGRLAITIRKATAGDCWSNRHSYFGFATESECANFMWDQNN